VGRKGDVTPGAETNPYRFRRINAAETGFKQIFLAAKASDGRKYSHDLWLATVKKGVDDAVTTFKKTHLLVTLNVGSLDGPEQFQAIGEHCVSRGCYVGQSGPAPARSNAFLVDAVGAGTESSLQDVSADGKTPVETVTIKELIPHVDATCRTVATREGRMIEGFSMGGSGAAKWGFKRTDLFGSISIVDGALHSSSDATSGKMAETLKNVYGGDKGRFAASDPWKLAEKNADKVKGRTAIRIVTGSRMLTGTNTKFHEK
jgi:hypothetical protein